MTPADTLLSASRILAAAASAIWSARDKLGDPFYLAIFTLFFTRGKVVVSGVGKSGLVARKIAATLSATGTPACFLHPTEAMHGDLGIVQDGDTAILVSNSGETEELLRLAAALKQLEVPLIAIVGNAASSLARQADLVIDTGISREACAQDLVATASSTAALALGDALACVLFEHKGADLQTLSRLHPAGALGQQIQLSVGKIAATEAINRAT